MTDDLAAAAQRDLAGLRRLGRRSRYDQQNRLWLLVVHAGFGLTVGGCFATWGVPAGWTTSLGTHPVTQTVVAVVPVAGALLLAAGLAAGRVLVLEAAGMAVMLGWEVVGVVVVLRWLHLADPGPLQYQVALYAAPAALMVVHLATLLAYLRDQRIQDDGRQQDRRRDV